MKQIIRPYFHTSNFEFELLPYLQMSILQFFHTSILTHFHTFILAYLHNYIHEYLHNLWNLINFFKLFCDFWMMIYYYQINPFLYFHWMFLYLCSCRHNDIVDEQSMCYPMWGYANILSFHQSVHSSLLYLHRYHGVLRYGRADHMLLLLLKYFHPFENI